MTTSPSTPPTSTDSSEPLEQARAVEPAEVQLTANTEAISDLFARAPMSWNEADMTRMIAHLRKKRTEFAAQEAAPKKAKAEKIPKEDLKGLSGEDLLGKLGLGGL